MEPDDVLVFYEFYAPMVYYSVHAVIQLRGALMGVWRTVKFMRESSCVAGCVTGIGLGG